QWEELSALDPEVGGAVRTFEICSGRGRGGAGRDHAPQGGRGPAQHSWSPAQHSWLRSHWVPRRDATTVMAELRYSVVACDSIGRARGTRGTPG
ncbi:EPHB4 protein, partial [Alaudala cheleensis]|nr:EPHB4 protein [Alaudala cheleensis]